MSRVYVTESGYFNDYGQFCRYGVIGVDKSAKLAVTFPIQKGCYRHGVKINAVGFAITYKSSFSNHGYRVVGVDII